MSEFLKDLEAKAYALVSGTIELDEFKSWYQLAMAAKAQPVAIEAALAQATPVPVRVVAAKGDEPEDDYRPSRAHLDGMDEPDPDWAVGTGDKLRKEGRLPQ